MAKPFSGGAPAPPGRIHPHKVAGLVLIGALGAGGALLIAIQGGKGIAAGPCQLCQCNGAVVPCAVPGATVPSGQACGICGGGTTPITPCLVATG